MKPTLALLFLLLVTFAALSQNPYTIAVGGNNNDVGLQTIQTKDSGFVTVGYTAGNNQPAHSYIFKIDKNRNLVWSKNIATASTDRLDGVVENISGELIVTGTTFSSTFQALDILIMKLTATGDVLWTKLVGGTSSDFAHTIIQSRDGNYIVGGSIGNASGTPNPEMLMLKMDDNGNLIWSRVFKFSVINSSSSIKSIRETTDGFIIGGEITTLTPSHDKKSIILKSDSLGNIQWGRLTANNSITKDVLQTKDGGYVLSGYADFPISGYGQYDTYISKLDESGNHVWSKRIGDSALTGPLRNNAGADVAESSDLALLVRSTTTEVGKSIITRFSNDGKHSYTKTINLFNASSAWEGELFRTLDNGYMITTVGGIGDVILMKLNENADACGNVVTGGYVADIAPLQSITATTAAVTLAVSAATSTVSNYGGLSVVCSGATLPVKIFSFVVVKSINKNELSWRTTQEINAASFEIERSSNGTDYNTIGKINAGVNSYTFIDNKPLTGQNYYRLKMMDKDGKFEYSAVRMVNYHVHNVSITVYPVPARNTITVAIKSTKSSKANVVVTDVSGKVLLNNYVLIGTGFNRTTINIQSLKKGSYFLKVITDEDSETKKITVY